MRGISWLALGALVCALPIQAQESLKLYGSMQSLSYSEASAIYQMVKNKWRDFPKADGHYAFTRNRMVLGVEEGLFHLEYVRRFDYNLSFSPDTAKLFYYMGGKHEMPLGKEFDARLKVQHLDAYGFRYGAKTPQWHGWQLGMAVSVLRGTGMQQGEINGSFSQTGKGEYQAFAPVDYHYSTDLLLEHDANGLGSPTGVGGALDLSLSWQTQRFKAELQVEDVYSYLRWKDAGVLQGTVDLSFAETDGKRETAFKHGVRGHEELIQEHLPTYAYFHSQYQLGHWQLQAGAVHYYDLLFPRVGGAFQWQRHNHQHELQFGYEFNSDKLSVGYQLLKIQSVPGGSLAFNLGSNTLRLSRAHVLEFGLSASAQW